ncbi:MAG: sulfatase [Planctomycetota bacterium]|nr:sulfatase [Planctomycetota bacterium]
MNFKCAALTSQKWLWAMLACLCVDSASAADRPNILFIFTDDHAPHAIGAYNGWLKGVNPTPNIDRLAAQGTLFENSFCTNSICGPSRAVILTGKHSHLNGFMTNGNRFNGDQQTFPKLLQKAGYTTAMLGKWHLSSNPQGFDHWKVLPGQGDYYNPFFLSANGREKVDGYCTDIVTDMAITWLNEQRDKDKPFMLMCQHKAPHRCWMPPLRHLNLYNDVEIPEAPTLFDKWTDNASPARFQEMEIDRHLHLVCDVFGPMPAGFDLTKQNTDRSGIKNMERMTEEQLKAWHAAYGPENEAFMKANLQGDDLVRWKYNRYIRNYLRCVKGVDESVGRLTDYLKEAGLDENTIVIYSSDQGFYLGDHGWYDKRWMYDESMKMPLIVKWPGVTKPGSRRTELVQNLDYGETFLDVAGAEIPADMQGKSLVPLLKGETPDDWRKSVYYHYYEYPSVHMVAAHFGVRTERYKLIRFYQFDEWEFYDLKEDPDELTNQYANAKYADEIATLKQELARLRKQYNDDSQHSVMPAEWRDKFRPAAPVKSR